MRLSEYTDYTLRVLMYCAAHRDRLVTIGELAEQHGLSRNHLMKVVNDLAHRGLLETTRGRAAGCGCGPSPIRSASAMWCGPPRPTFAWWVLRRHDQRVLAITGLPTEAPFRRCAGRLLQGPGRRHAGGYDWGPHLP